MGVYVLIEVWVITELTVHVLLAVHASFSLQKRGIGGDVPVTLQLTLFDGEEALTSFRRGDCTVTSECPIRVGSFHR